MKTISLLAVLLFSALTLHAQMGEAEQKAMMEYGTPGDMHKMLSRDNGGWQEDIIMWMKPGAEPMKMQTTVVSDMIMEGRYQQQMHDGEMMGMPFHGVSTTGYDNARKVFVNTWIDNFGTGIMVSEGRWDAKTNSIEFKGKVTDPMAGGKQMPFRQVLYFVDDSHQRVEMYQMHEGKEFKSMEMMLTKR